MSTSSSAIALQCNEPRLVESTEAVASSEIAVSVRNLGKSYRLWNNPQDRLKQPLRSIFGRWLPIPHKQYFREFWALRDINFDVKKGETLGIIGRNGSGKSTLLQILCGTLAPTCGSYETRGRVSALLELGSGFNPEFSGRDNVYMNASILGLTKEEIDDRYESIVEFADIGQFIDQPVKTYSSGMYVRLAFAVAISVDPDILVVDEALSVGDIEFQAKCITRIKKFIDRGNTLLFVSHDVNSVKSVCKSAILLSSGEVQSIGRAADVADQYATVIRGNLIKTGEMRAPYKKLELSVRKKIDAESIRKRHEIFIKKVDADRYGDGRAKVILVDFVDQFGNTVKTANFDQKITIKIYFQSFEKDAVSVNYYIRDMKMLEIMGCGFRQCGHKPITIQPGETYVVEYETTLPLREGYYSIETQITSPIVIDETATFLDVVPNAYQFEISRNVSGRVWSCVHVPHTFRIKKIANI